MQLLYRLEREHFPEHGSAGEVWCSNIGAPPTGFVADILIFDSPMEYGSSGLSEEYKDRFWDNVSDDFMTRCYSTAKVVYFTTLQPGDGTTTALRSLGFEIHRQAAVTLHTAGQESVWPEHFSTERLMKIKEGISEPMWRSMYLCEDVT